MPLTVYGDPLSGALTRVVRSLTSLSFTALNDEDDCTLHSDTGFYYRREQTW